MNIQKNIHIAKIYKRDADFYIFIVESAENFIFVTFQFEKWPFWGVFAVFHNLFSNVHKKLLKTLCFFCLFAQKIFGNFLGQKVAFFRLF